MKPFVTYRRGDSKAQLGGDHALGSVSFCSFNRMIQTIEAAGAIPVGTSIKQINITEDGFEFLLERA